MKIEGIKSLYFDMKKKDIQRYQFNYKNGKGEFDIFFFIDENPFVLLFGAKGTNFSFEIKVHNGFQINTFLDIETLNKLKKILGIKGGSTEEFSTNKFFQDFNQNIPKIANKSNIAQPHKIIKYRNDVEEAEKIYFWQWRDNEKRGDQVTLDNLEKTKKLLGIEAYKRCKEKNISSCWTDDVKKNKDILFNK